MKKPPQQMFILALCVVLAGCATNRSKVLDSGISAVEIRSYQSRAFDSVDRVHMLRAVIATLQDLEFMIEDVSSQLGTVSANKSSGLPNAIRISVFVRPRGETQMLVRASLQHLDEPVHDPEPYLCFFTALRQTLFLIARETE
jgi:hypothetical protein